MANGRTLWKTMAKPGDEQRLYPWKMVVGRPLSFGEGQFSGGMLVLGRVQFLIANSRFFFEQRPSLGTKSSPLEIDA